MTLGWTNGRQLYHANQTGGNDAWYHYDSAGIRTSKTVNAWWWDFTYVDGKLIHQTDGDSILWFYYDASDKLVAMEYNGTMYYYMYDSIGNIIGLMDTNGVEVATYSYDAWGQILNLDELSDIAEINPMRYKGYYYDTETGYYYLMSRYYDPVVGRFLNADGFASTGVGVLGYNMYAYCNNNPIALEDSQGTRPIASTSVSNESDFDRSYSMAYTRYPDASVEYLEKYVLEKVINTKLLKYEDVKIIASSSYFEIKNSYRVVNADDRMDICQILEAHDGLGQRTAENYAAEWIFHNDLFNLFDGAVAFINADIMLNWLIDNSWFVDQRDSAQHARLDINGDGRWYVRGPTNVYDFWGRR